MARIQSRIRHTVSRFSKTESRTALFLAFALIVAGAAAIPLFSQAGLLNTRGGGDSPFLLQRLQQLYSALADGQFPVRWMPDANYGYGYPFYNYYAPLSIYVAAVFRFLGLSFVQAIKFTQLSGFLVAAGGMFYLGWSWIGNRWAGLLAAAAYTLAPFHLVNVYVRGDSLAEFWAMAFYPLVFLAIDRIVGANLFKRGGRVTTSSSTTSGKHFVRASLAILALAYSALILSHNISALILSAFIFFYLLIGAWGLRSANSPSDKNRVIDSRALENQTPKKMGWVLLALFLALLLSAWFWLPALAESSLVQLEPVTEGYFHFSNHFRGIDLVQPDFFFDFDVKGDPFRMGIVQATAIVLGLIALFIRPKPVLDSQPGNNDSLPARSSRSRYFSAPRIFILAGLIVATFMITPLSRVLWENLPLLPFTQFPWRFLSVQAFFGALAIAGLALLPWRRVIVPVSIILMFVATLGRLELDFLTLTDEDVTIEKLALYEWFTGNIGSTVSAEYLPDTVQHRPFTSAWLNFGDRDAVQQLNGTLVAAHNNSRQSSRQSWRIDVAGSGAAITFPTIDWLHWRGRVDGTDIDLLPAPGSGLLASQITEGEHELDFRLSRTPLRLASEIAALAGLVLLIWLVLPGKSWRPTRSFLYLLVTLIFIFILLRFLPERKLGEEDLTWDFAQMAYLHHDSDGVLFENGAVLSSYQYSAEEAVAGDDWAISLLWQDVGVDVAATVELFTPAVHRFRRAPSLIGDTKPVSGEQSDYMFTIPINAPDGLYVPRLTVNDAQALTPSGQKRGDLFLRPVRIRGSTQAADRVEPMLEARAIEVRQRNPRTLDIQLQWSTMQSLTKNYNYSLRLVDAHGLELAQNDGQPGYGFQPSSLWQAGTWVDDWLAMALPEDLLKASYAAPLALIVHLYDAETGQVVLVRRLGEIVLTSDELSFRDNQRSFDVPAKIDPIQADYGVDAGDPIIGLRGYQVVKGSSELDVTLYWQALLAGSEDYYHFAHLVDPVTGQIVAQHDSMPMNGTYPTSQWAEGEIVADRIALDISQVPAGDYELALGLYRISDGSFPRLIVVDEQGIQLPADRLTLPEIVSIGG